MDSAAGRVRREVLVLVVLVVLVEAGFICLAILAGLRHSGAGLKLAFTVVWTVATLAVVLRGLTRIRAARLGGRGAGSGGGPHSFRALQ